MILVSKTFFETIHVLNVSLNVSLDVSLYVSLNDYYQMLQCQ